MSAFDAAMKLLLTLEGGYVHHSDDHGGETRWGISKRSYPNVDIANLSKHGARQIYYRDFWTPVAQRVTDPAMRLLVFDAAVNHGLSRALKWAREFPTFHAYLANRLQFYASLSTWPTFGKGWTRRVAAVVQAAEALQEPLDGRRVVDVLVDNRGVFSRLLAAVRGSWGPAAINVRPLADGKGLKLDVDTA